MCRLLAFPLPLLPLSRSALQGFPRQAQTSLAGPKAERHPDGWGVACTTPSASRYLGRSAHDASTDPAFAHAVSAAAKITEPGFLLAHLRQASLGPVTVANSHPFIGHGWMFAHNGTVRDLPELAECVGDTDSERLFQQLRQELRRTEPRTALRRVLEPVEASGAFTALSFVLANSDVLYAYRRTGPLDPDGWGREACSRYYSLGIATSANEHFIAQERTHLGAIDSWEEIPEGNLVEWRRGGKPRDLGPLCEPPIKAARSSTAR